MTQASLYGRKILLIVGGGIAAYKALELVRLLRKAGAEVMSVLTAAGAEFVTPMSLAALTGHPVRQALFMPEDETAMGHIELSRWADLVVVAYGTVGRIAKTAVGLARAKGQKVGLIRPISLWPYPTRAFDAVAASVKGFLTVEMNMGQMVEDVRLAVNGRVPVWHQRRLGGIMPTSEEIAARIDLLIGEVSGA